MRLPTVKRRSFRNHATVYLSFVHEENWFINWLTVFLSSSTFKRFTFTFFISEPPNILLSQSSGCLGHSSFVLRKKYGPEIYVSFFRKSAIFVAVFTYFHCSMAESLRTAESRLASNRIGLFHFEAIQAQQCYQSKRATRLPLTVTLFLTACPFSQQMMLHSAPSMEW